MKSFAMIFCAAALFAPALVSEAKACSLHATTGAQAPAGIRMGDNNRLILDDTRTAAASRLGAQNSIGSIVSGSSIRIGDNNTISASGRQNSSEPVIANGNRVGGAQTICIGSISQAGVCPPLRSDVARNAVGSIVTGNR